MPDRQISEDMLPHLKNLCLADPNYFVPQGIDILLGSDIYDELMLSEAHRGQSGAPFAQNTTLGYTVSEISRNEASNELDDLLQRFWELEQFDRKFADLSEEERCVRLPFLTPLDSAMVLGESYRAALKRLRHLERRLRADDNLKEVYTATINENLELGQMIPVKSSKDSYMRTELVEGVKHCYLPHHPVTKESSSTTKVLVDFDGSMKTNSMIVLSWTKGGAAKWKLFVSNRISKILETSETSQLRHVATADNPADHLSRGLSVNNLSSSELWGHGPQWLQAAESEWPTTEIDIGSTTEVSNEMKSVSSNRVSIEQMPHVNLLERYSSYTHMLRVIAYVERFVRNCKVLRCERRTEGLCVDELSNSFRSVTGMVQLEYFTADWKALQLGKTLPKDSTLLSLNP
ncbi:hypothetical protein ACLKA6_008555 [Drosophila palustris]